VADTGYNGARAMSSSDGSTWGVKASDENAWTDVTYGAGKFVAVASTGNGFNVMTSPDGDVWTAGNTAVDSYWTGITYGNGLFLAVASGGDGQPNHANLRIMTSPDGVSWTARFGPSRYFKSVTFGNGIFVAVSVDGGSRQIIRSTYDYETIPCHSGSYDITSNGVATNGTTCDGDIATPGSLSLDLSTTEVGNGAFAGANLTGHVTMP
jgi:hypothetical protein